MCMTTAHIIISDIIKRNPKGATHAQILFEVYEAVGYDKFIHDDVEDLLDAMCTPPAANIPAELVRVRGGMDVAMRVYAANA